MKMPVPIPASPIQRRGEAGTSGGGGGGIGAAELFLQRGMLAEPAGLGQSPEARGAGRPAGAGFRARACQRSERRRVTLALQPVPSVRGFNLSGGDTHAIVSRGERARACRRALHSHQRRIRARAEEVRPGRDRHRDQDRQHQPLQRAGIGLRHHRARGGRLLQDDQRPGRRSTAARSTSSAWTTATARRARWSRSASWWRRSRCCSWPARWARRTNTAIHKYVNAKKVPHIFVNTGATKWGDPKNFPWTMGFNLNYQAEGDIYAKYILDEQARREDRHPLPERRLRQRLRQGAQGRARRQGREDDRRRGELRGHRPDRRFADRHPAGLRRRHLLQRHHAEVRRPGDPQGLRHRLAPAAHPQQRVGVGRLRC